MATRPELAADAWGSLLHAHAALVPHLDDAVRAATGLPLAWYDVLLELAHAPGGRLRVGDLGDRVVLSRSRVSRIVDEIAAHGLVGKEDDPADRRSTYAVLTAAGRAQQKSAARVYLRAIEDLFAGGLKNDELRQLTDLLTRVNAHAHAHTPQVIKTSR